MRQIQCLIVDDEPIARDIIRSYCNHLPFLRIIAECSNALEAKEVLESEKIDLLFLDIEMPVLGGLAFVKTLRNVPKLIFTTAYTEYAAAAFDLAAADYLVKPFSLERFIIAVDKAIDNYQPVQLPVINESNQHHMYIKTDGRIYRVEFDTILYAEARGNYTQIITQDKTFLPPLPFSVLTELLPVSFFMRVHRSYIINHTKISFIEGNTIHVGTATIPIGSNYKDALMKLLGL